MFSKRHMVRVIFIACFAVLMAALAPTVSQLLAVAEASAASMQAGGMHAGATGDPVRNCHTSFAHPLSNHCGYCVMQADLPYLPTPGAGIMPPEPPASMAPLLLHLTPSPLLVWLAAQPRAPPAA